MPTFQDNPAAKIKQLADYLRPMVNPATYLLESPSVNYLVLNGSRPEDIKAVVDWGIFNPYGPTLFTISLINSPLTNESFVFENTDNPFGSTRKIYGLLPNALVMNQQKLGAVLATLFGQFGTDITGNYPTMLNFLPGSPLIPLQIKEMFKQAMFTDPPDNLARDCERLARFKGRPWDRATAEQSDALEAIVSGKTPPTMPLTVETFDKWWSLITDPYHVRAEAAQLPIAWEGAKKHARPF